PRVVATLWEIDDRTAAEVMKRFYEGILARGERPPSALRAAQVATWKTKGWAAPYYWAAFTLQGEWRTIRGPWKRSFFKRRVSVEADFSVVSSSCEDNPSMRQRYCVRGHANCKLR